MQTYDYLIVGAGIAGCVAAERLATLGKKILLVDRRLHIGGNCYDEYNSSGVLVHRYGPHYFRTNSAKVIHYLSKFTQWNTCEYKVLAYDKGRYWQFPINLNTFEQYIERKSSPLEMKETLERWRIPIENPRNSEELIVSKIGWDLYEKFYRGYTYKQWDVYPSELSPSVCGRIPIRFNRDDRYLSEEFQAMPKHGYTLMFHNMVDHPNIAVRLGCDYKEIKEFVKYNHLIYTGPIDEFYNHCFGRLPYRSLRFEEMTFKQEFLQPVVQINYPNEGPYTRDVEIKHVTCQKIPITTIIREFPIDGPEPFYPVPCIMSQELYKSYDQLAQKENNVTFIGRLATYKYLNMDQVVLQALNTVEKL